MNTRLRVLPVRETEPRFAEFLAVAPAMSGQRVATQAQMFERYGQRRHLLLLDGDEPVGRATASVNPLLAAETLGPVKGTIGYLGDLAFPDDAAALEVLLGAAFEWLGAAGCQLVRAPVTYHTWYPFRFVTELFEEPPLPGEPWNPPYFAERFADAGFVTRVHYESRTETDLPGHLATLQADKKRLEASDLIVRHLDLDHLEDDLRRMHALAQVTFARNFSFSPIDFDEFRIVQGPTLGVMSPEYVYLVEDPARPPQVPQGLAAFLFWFPDPRDPRAAIYKTLGVHPHYRGRWVGAGVHAISHEQAHAKGVERAEHVLMRSGVPPATTSSRTSVVSRRYVLMDRTL